MLKDQLLLTMRTPDRAPAVRVIGWDACPLHTQSPLKRRDCAVIHYVLKGEGWFDGIKVRAGQGFYFPANEPHTYHADPEKPWYYIFMDVTQEFADWYVVPAAEPDKRGIFTFSFADRLDKWVGRTFEEKSHTTTISPMEAIYQAMSILRRHSSSKVEFEDKQKFYVEKAKLFIENSLSQRLTVVDVAKAVNLNDRYLCSLFVQYEHVTTKEFIMDRKIHAACELLSNTDLSIKEIAQSLAFSDGNSFSKNFKAKTNRAPSEYREQNR